ncbi:MAG: hypothetical protein ACP5G0_04080 [Desulfomonilia bacterium]
MEVKSIFVNYILKSYEKQNTTSTIDSEKVDHTLVSDSVNISPHATKRLFGDLMEHSLKKGLSEVLVDEN